MSAWRLLMVQLHANLTWKLWSRCQSRFYVLTANINDISAAILAAMSLDLTTNPTKYVLSVQERRKAWNCSEIQLRNNCWALPLHTAQIRFMCVQIIRTIIRRSSSMAMNCILHGLAGPVNEWNIQQSLHLYFILKSFCLSLVSREL